jgi:intracellular sulfur oxidation DsrE/DsrF family protein
MRLKSLAIILAFLAVGLTPANAQTVLSDPKPSMENPRRIALMLSTDDPKIVNQLLFNVINIQKFYGMDKVELVVVAFGAGLRAVMEDTSPVAARIRSQQHYGVRFIACGNTMDAMKKKRGSLIKGVEWVQAGLPELVERHLRGWVILNPY